MNTPHTVSVLKSNWFSKSPDAAAETFTFLTVLTLFLGALMFFSDALGSRAWMPATVDGVLLRHEYWRLWTALFAHADLGHLLSNTLLFIPLAYVLNGYFGSWIFPAAGFLIAGAANYLTLLTMAAGSSLIGASGLVFWMGAAWLTLYTLVETRESIRRRMGKALVIGAALFFPQGFEPNISYTAHFYGFAMGFTAALTYYAVAKSQFANMEVRESIIEEDLEHEGEDFQVDAFVPNLPRGYCARSCERVG